MIWTWKRQVVLAVPVLGIAVMLFVSGLLPKEEKLPLWVSLCLVAIQWLILGATWGAKPWTITWLARALMMENEKLIQQLEEEQERIEERKNAQTTDAGGSDHGTERGFGALRRWLRARVRPRHRGAAGDAGGEGELPPRLDEREDLREGPDADRPGAGPDDTGDSTRT